MKSRQKIVTTIVMNYGGKYNRQQNINVKNNSNEKDAKKGNKTIRFEIKHNTP